MFKIMHVSGRRCLFRSGNREIIVKRVTDSEILCRVYDETGPYYWSSCDKIWFLGIVDIKREPPTWWTDNHWAIVDHGLEAMDSFNRLYQDKEFV